MVCVFAMRAESEIGGGGELTLSVGLGVAEPDAALDSNKAITCEQLLQDSPPSSLECQSDGQISLHISVATKCCTDGRSYCPAPQLCAGPAAFNPFAQYNYICMQYGMSEAECPLGCRFINDPSAASSCNCFAASDYDSCAALLPGALDVWMRDGAGCGGASRRAVCGGGLNVALRGGSIGT